MATIHKQALHPDPTGLCTLQVPFGTEFLHAATQGDQLCVWYRCDPDRFPLESRQVMVVPTGGEAPEAFPAGGETSGYAEYLGTAFMGPFVWHVFVVH